jgi:ATPase subunit of ABC transporter with duplicated ATPase domains
VTRAPVIQTTDLTQKFGDRVLFQDLNLSLQDERVALVGRNGVGKSSLLSLLSGDGVPAAGSVKQRGSVYLVPQVLLPGAGSPGERRREALRQARESSSQVLLLDEPTQDLDRESVEWLRWWLARYGGGALVATHDQRLLKDFRHFFVMLESGCRYVSGTFEELVAVLEDDFHCSEKRYLRRLSRLAREEERTLHLARRRRRKKQYGRARELDRATPRSTLNMKRSAAQESHGKINQNRQRRLEEMREWTRGARRDLRVALPLVLEMPELLPCSGVPVTRLEGVSMELAGRSLFQDLSLTLDRDRLALVGPNGSGKTTFLRVLLQQLMPTKGSVRTDLSRIGYIAQGGSNWMISDSLVKYLADRVDSIGAHLTAFKFPLALAERPLSTLSSGERVRAALIGILATNPVPDMLILDEPIYSLDILGQQALGQALRAWPGGLVVTSHQREFLESVGFDQVLSVGE